MNKSPMVGGSTIFPLSLHAVDTTAGVWIDAINEKNMCEYFALLREVYDEFDFDGHPQ